MENVRAVFDNDAANFTKALVNSAIVAGTVSLSVLVFSSLAGFAFAKLRFRGSNVLLLLVVASMSIPVQLGVIPLYILMGKLGWNGDLKAVIVPFLVSAFGVFFMRQAIMEAVPDELLEAGRIDGCGLLRLWARVVVPAVRPAAAVLGLFTFMMTWNDFLWPLVTLTPDEPDGPGLAVHAGIGLLPGLLAGPGGHRDRHRAAARAVLRRRAAADRRHHGGGGQGMSGRSRHGRFPADFVWGVATAAYQIEGAAAVGRPRAVDLGHVQPQRRRRRGPQRRRRVRPLPPLARGSRPAAVARGRRVPVLDRVAAGAARRARAGRTARAGVLRPARRRPARARHPAVGVALPLGPAAGARGRGRLARARHGLPVRGVRRARVRPARRPRRRLDHGQRAVVRRRCSATPRASTRRAARTTSRPSAPSTTRCSPTASRSRRCGRRGATGLGFAPNLYHVTPASDGRGRHRRGAAHRRPPEPAVPRPGAARQLSRRRDRGPRARDRPRAASTTATWR